LTRAKFREGVDAVVEMRGGLTEKKTPSQQAVAERKIPVRELKIDTAVA
jgi:hypothetical protein